MTDSPQNSNFFSKKSALIFYPAILQNSVRIRKTVEKNKAILSKENFMRRHLSYLAIIFTLLISACNKPMAFEYRDLRNLKLENVSGEKSKVSMNLVYYNPNSFGVNLKNVNCEIFIDTMYVGKLQLDTMMHIDKTSEFSLPASFDVNINNLLKSSVNLLFNEVTIRAKGTTRVGKGGIFVNVPIDYSGKQKLNLF